MENFIVSARKYRPQTFDTVVGQKSITNTLKNAIKNNQLAQAFLFCGPRGVGKTTCARILAKTINCAFLSPNMEACDQCPSCVSFNENASFNIYELDGASNNSVDDIRTLVDQVRIPPQMGKYKVYIIDEVHMLSASAFNAFLKTLEEPPPYAKFILATTEKHKILPTILSRCQIFDFKRITVDDIAGHLHHVAEMEHITADDNALHIIAQKADGAMRDALSIFDQLVSFAGDQLTYNTVLENLNVLDYEYFFKITDQILQGDISGPLLTINDIIGKGFEGQHFIIGFGEHLRNLLVCKDTATAGLLETAPSIRAHYVEQSARCPVSLLLTLLDINNRCDLNYKTSNNKRLHLELSLMQMCAPMIRQNGGQTAPPAAAIAPPAPPKPAPVAVVPGLPSQETTVQPPASHPQPPAPVVQHAEAGPGQPESSGSPAETPPRKPSETVRMRDIKSDFTSTTSIRKPVSKTGNDALANDEDLARYEITTPFTQTELILCWDEYADKLKNESPHLYSTLKNSRPVLQDNWNITFTLDNKVLEDELTLRKTDMMEFLRMQLNNFKIQLKTTIAESQQTLKPYTDKEKFELMAGKNPALRTLREELDLEIEY
ncbi:MAG: DNA polymerase III subunit gamma/tau [Bacteroidetes bacterium]|nr:DNA polymerase III subunit gamma/tau [Bacteroidota bacterium]